MTDDPTCAYLAARFSRRNDLIALGCSVTSCWLIDSTPEPTEETWRSLAEKDREGIKAAGVLLLFAEAERKGVAAGMLGPAWPSLLVGASSLLARWGTCFTACLR